VTAGGSPKSDAARESVPSPVRLRGKFGRRAKRIGIASVILFAASFVALSLTLEQIAGPERSTPLIVLVESFGEPLQIPEPATDAGTAAADSSPTRLRVMTLNLAHGRGTSWNQTLCSRQKIEANLDAIARVVRREAPHVLAVQEADGPSIWSGRFDHVRFLTERSGLASFARGEHVQGLGLAYGTGVISRYSIESSKATTFPSSPPSPSKGFTIATIAMPAGNGSSTSVDVVSLHLDFSRRSIRSLQVALLTQEFERSGRPLIIAGDFNAEWDEEDSPVKRIATSLELEAWKPEADDMETFPFLGRRLDWILVSREFQIIDARVLSDRLSDHRAVIAEIARR
jgi:endonuclease/exonuclease/phosphatase family metal-dependent hydrolase